MKTAAQAAAKYKAVAGTLANAQLWSGNFVSAIPKMQTKAKAKVDFWQSQVSTAQAKADYLAGIDRMDVNATTAKATTSGQSSYQGGVTRAADGKYLTFQNTWTPVLATQLANLDRTNPSGDAAAQDARMLAQVAWARTQHGKFKQ